MNAISSGRRVLLGWSLLATSAALVAQQPVGSGTQPGGQVPGVPNPGLQNPVITDPTDPSSQGIGAQGVGQPQQVDEFSPVWMNPRQGRFSGFPTFPSRLQGYGNYPLPIDPNTPGTGLEAAGLPTNSPLGPGIGFPLLPPAEPEPPGWPSWVRNQAKEPLPFSPADALLVGHNQRVWWRPNADEAFVPLFYYRKFASLQTGAEVEVRRSGEFEVQLHDSTRVVSRGPARLQLGALDEENVNLDIESFTWLRLRARDRVHRIALPDGSMLILEPEAEPVDDGAAAPAAPPNPFAALLGGAAAEPELPSPALVELRRLDEPGWFGGRATITNLGGYDVRWQHAMGTEVLGPAQRLMFFLTPSQAPGEAGLQAGNAQVQRDGGNAVCRTDVATEVQWCGAKIVLPKGGKVSFESLQGDAFAKPAPAARPGG